MIVGSQYSGLKYYENIGTEYEASYIVNENIYFPQIGFNTYPSFFEENNPNNLLVGVSTGGLYYLSLNSCEIGDLNGDSIVNIIDIIAIVNLIIENIDLTSDVLCVADINNDNVINVIDIIELVNMIILDL